MANIGDKLRAIDEQAQTPANRPENKEPAEGSRETVMGGERSGGITNRPLEQERDNQERVPPRGDNKEGAHA